MTEDFLRRFDLLSKKAAQLYRAGQYEQAIVIAARARDLARQYTKEEHLAYAVSLHRLGFLYYAKGDYTAVEPLYLEALTIARSHLGEAHPQVAFVQSDLATLYQAMGAYEKAEPLFQQALDIRRNRIGEAPADFVVSLNNLGELYRRMGSLKKSEALFEEALQVGPTVLGENHPEVTTVQSNLAALYIALGKYQKAEPLLQHVVDVTHISLGEEHPYFVTGLHNLAVLYYKMGRYDQAESLFQQTLNVQSKVLGEMHPDTATLLDHLGLLYQVKGAYAQAKPRYEQALEIRRNTLGEGHPDVATSLDNLGKLHHEMSDFTQAADFYTQAYEIRRRALGEKHADVAISMLNVAVLYHYLRRYKQAEALYEKALAITREVLGDRHPNFATILVHQAALYRDLNDYARAKLLFQQAIDIQRAVLGESHPDVAISLNHLATCYSLAGDHAQAGTLYKEALHVQSAVLGETHPNVADSLNNLATVYVATGRLDEALELMERAATIDDEMIGQVFSLGSERQRMAYLASLQWHFYVYLSLVLSELALSTIAVQKGLNLVLRRKGVGAEALAVQRDFILSGRYPDLVPELQELTRIRRQIIEKKLAGPDPETVESHRWILDEWNKDKEQLERELAHHIPEIDLSKRLHAANWENVAQVLPAGAKLVEFIHYYAFDFHAVLVRNETVWKPAHYAAFVLSAGVLGNVQLINLGEAEKIDEMIAQFRTSIINEPKGPGERHLKLVPVPSNQSTATSASIALRTTIFDPLLTALEDCKRLFLAPDGDLTLLPFEVLPTDDGRFLIDEYEISYLSAGRDVLRFENVPPGLSSSPLIIADPDFDLGIDTLSSPPVTTAVYEQHTCAEDRSSLHFGRLPGTQREGQEIATMLKVRPVLGREALEAHLKAYRSPSILHIATHGFFLSESKHEPNARIFSYGVIEIPGASKRSRLERLSGEYVENPLLRSGLALAGANTWNRGGLLPPEAEDGLLTAEDVSGLDLLDTEMVVLSACETGLGEVHIGEGVFGLRRTFMLAGAKTLVMSLWQVPDQRTQELMVDFYRRILAGQPRAAALREAQLAMKAKYPTSYGWGAFICQGDPRPLTQISAVHG